MLKGKKVNLRLVRKTDLDDLVRFQQDVSNRGDYFPMSIRSESVIRKKFDETGLWGDDFHTMVMADPASDRVLGTISTFKPCFNQDSWEIGYILFDLDSRGKGITVEAVRLFVGYIFKWQYMIHRIQIQADKPNLASTRVAEKAGFTHEGTLRCVRIHWGKPVDGEVYSLTRSEWEAWADS